MRKLLPALLVVLACARVAFATCPAGPPTLQTPADGATVPFGPVILSWSLVPNATAYEIWAGLDNGPLNLIGTEPDGQKTVNLEPGRYIEWKVVATAPSCTPMASAHAMFETSCPNVVPSLRNPDAGDTFPVGATISFLWTGVPGAAGYDVKVSNDDGNTWNVLASDITTTSFSTNNLPEGEWDWEVRANFNGSCAPAYSEPSNFNVTSCATAAPELTQPANGATHVANPVTFKWRSVAGATSYILYVGADGGTPQPLGTTNETQLTRTLASGHEIKWYVQAVFGGTTCPPASSEKFELTLEGDEGCIVNPGKATLVSPAANASNLASPVLFDWNPVNGATGYRLLIGTGDGEPVVLGTTTETQLSVKLPKGSGVWLVQTLFGDDCPTTFSERRAFTVAQGAACPTAAPTLVAPQNNSANNARTVTFQWTGVTDAIGYALYVATGGDNDFQLYGETDAHTTQLQRLVPAGRVDWYVQARFTGCPPTKSSVFRFGSEEECNLTPVSLTAPAADAQTTSPVAFSWGAVPTATEYRLTIRGEGGDTALVQRFNTTSTSVRLPAGTFFWRVEALRGDCRSSSEERRFVVNAGANCGNNPAPATVSPLGTEAQPANVGSPVAFQWGVAQGAIGYRVFISRNGEPFSDIALTAETTKSIELEPGHYAWFVQALFENCAPTRSAQSYFNIAEAGCNNPAPQILTPAANASVTSPVTITWTAVQNAIKYRVLALVDDVPTLVGTTEDTTLTEVLPKGTTTITVEAVFRECRSTFAPRVTFNVIQQQNCPTDAPTLVSPPNGAALTDPEVDFVWQPVSGALKYALVAALNDGAETILGTTEDTHLQRTLPAGTIHWRVIVFYAGCESRNSAKSTFTVARAQGCTDRKPVLLFPRDGQDVPSPIEFAWLGVPSATDYRVWVIRRGEQPGIAATTSDTSARVELPPGTYRWFVEARFANNCPPTFSAQEEFRASEPVPCTTPKRPEAHVIGTAVSGVQYALRWTPLANVSRYEVQEATALDFSNAQTFSVNGLSKRFAHDNSGAPVQYLYRVRGFADCNDAPGPYSDIVGIFIVATKTNNASVELGEGGAVVQTINLPGGATPLQFTAKTDKPWLHVTPASGTLPTTGLTLTVTADPSALDPGTNTGTVQIQYSGGSAKGVATHDGGSTSVIPMSVSLVTPVTDTGKGTPPPDALIFGAVGHAQGVNDSLFESDIRLANISAQTMRYDLNFTPSGVDGTQTGSSTSIEVGPGETLALDDIVSSMFGSGTASSLGMLEVRPITTSGSPSGGLFGSISSSAQEVINTIASSRTYNFTPNGTFGQFIPATRFADFVGRDAVLSIQQVAQSAKQRANFGFLEASGQGADLIVRVYDAANTLIATIPVSLAAMQHRQLNGLLQTNGINDLEDGRVEVEVVNGDGKVTAYVSEIDNATNDPLLISPVIKGATQADRYIVPGMAYLNTGSAFWVTDLRVFNSGTTSTPATLTFYPQGDPAHSVSRDVTLGPCEIEVLNNVLVNLFGFNTNQGGSIVITTPSMTSLTATARTYNQTANGTYGQFIPGVTVAESVGLGDRTLQILQLEQSTRIRSNVGLNETTGKPVTVEVSLITPDSLTTPVVTIGLQGNEYRQIGLVDFHMPDAVYNGRVTVKVIEGEGKVTAYGSAIDQITQDPTYVKAQ